jgi:cellulose synthase/poly-beta-1,6-N-acetylglucosamine synthase-like glycosyltransferase
MRITVLIPTYRRPHDLARCLKALQQQRRAADEVLVVVQKTDLATWDFLKTLDPSLLPLYPLTVEVQGVVAALNTGFDAAQGDIIAITDDDAAPHPDWLERIEAHFLADNRLGAVGGRDWIYMNGALLTAVTHPGASQPVGKLQWFGRLIGNHHTGTGPTREVDVLKGVNMSYRKVALADLRCDERLRGTGAQVHFELGLCFGLKQRGWRLIYDPAIAVDHYPAQRFDQDQREHFNSTALVNAVHNETLMLMDYLPPIRRWVFLTWAVLVGTRSSRGILQFFRFWPSEGPLSGQKWWASWQGRWHGWRTWRQTKSPSATKPLSFQRQT